MSETIKLKFRRGGDWNFEPGCVYIGRDNDRDMWVFTATAASPPPTNRAEYAGPFVNEEPEPEPLKLDGYEIEVHGHVRDWFVTAFGITAGGGCRTCLMRTYGSTRREAIENFNHLARKMGEHK